MRAEDLHHRVVLDHRRGDRVRVDGVDPNAVLPQLQCESVGQRGESVLGGRVVPVAGRGLHSAGGTDDDDRAAVARLDHRRDDRPKGAPGAGEVGVDDGVPLFVGELPESAPTQHSGVGNQNVEPAELLDAVDNQRSHRGVVADVDLPRQRLAALGLNESHGLGQIFRCRCDIGNRVGDRRADIADDDIGTLTGQSHRVGAALTARGSGDECDSSIQIGHQQSSRQAPGQASKKTGTCFSAPATIG